MATHSSVLTWRIPGTGEPGRLLSIGSHRVRHDWSDLAAAADCTEYSEGQSCQLVDGVGEHGAPRNILCHTFCGTASIWEQGVCPPESGWALWPPDLQNSKCRFLARPKDTGNIYLPSILFPHRMDCLRCHTPETAVLNKERGKASNKEIPLMSMQFNLWLKNWIHKLSKCGQRPWRSFNISLLPVYTSCCGSREQDGSRKYRCCSSAKTNDHLCPHLE